ncbi:MAG: aminoacyl-tRNA hydrolase [Selenomonadaceae bacterium]|nr:aminoacyl-tRNA hydrolase [Selenomonadaceae bacterium]MBQ3726772.1 aminoacyl-tRNA hydrolase [Selenomonadaceae bacterium]MBQ9496880.1 aminoacyl-tRNA hydrolase [Selenomonadaceae bacterium]
MKIFVGLGNPTAEYAATKHNVGFMLADKLAEKISATEWREKFNALVAESFFDGEKILIVKPQTFMNLSGEAVGPLMNFYKLGVEDLTVAHDDMDLPLGMIRLRPKGSGGGHHGVESIIQHLGGEKNFPRVRIGVGRPPKNWTVNHHVLSPFTAEDAQKISAALDELVPAVLCIFKEGIDNAMNKFNPRKVKAHEEKNLSVND